MKHLLALLFISLSITCQAQISGAGPVQTVVPQDQAKRLGNEWIKPCLPNNHAAVCFESNPPNKQGDRFVVKSNCELLEHTECKRFGDYWISSGDYKKEATSNFDPQLNPEEWTLDDGGVSLPSHYAPIGDISKFTVRSIRHRQHTMRVSAHGKMKKVYPCKKYPKKCRIGRGIHHG